MKKEVIVYECPKNSKHQLRQNSTYSDMKTCDQCKSHWTITELVQKKTQSASKSILLQNFADEYNYPFLSVEFSQSQRKNLLNYQQELQKLPREFQVKLSLDIFCKVLIFETFKIRNDEKKTIRENLNEKSMWTKGFLDFDSFDLDWALCEYESLKTMKGCDVVLTTQSIQIVKNSADPFGPQVNSIIPWAVIAA